MLNALRHRIKMLRANPCLIKPEFCALTPSKPSIPAIYQGSIEVNHDSHVLRFRHKVGQHININYQGTEKAYVPISRIDDPGFVDVLVKKISSGASSSHMSNKLITLPKGAEVTLKGPYGRWAYLGNGLVERTVENIKNKYRYIGLVAHGTALTSFFSMIEAVGTSNDSTSLSLLWQTNASKDFFFLEELNYYLEQNTLNFNLMLDRAEADWLGPAGPISASHVNRFLPPPTPQTLIIVSGPREFVSHNTELCQALGYQNIIY